MERKVVTYSEAFKRQVVEQMECGKFVSVSAAQKAYGIRGSVTIQNWLRKYGREDLLPKKVRIETMKERDELKEMKKRNRELEAALADAHVEFCLEKAYLRVACERLGTSVETLKKKNAMTLSDMRRRMDLK